MMVLPVELIAVVTFFVVFGWFGVVAWCDLLRPSQVQLVAGHDGSTLLASVRSIVMFDEEMLIELCPEPGRDGNRLPRWFTTSVSASGAFLERWRDQHRAVEVIGDTSAPTLRRGGEEVQLSVLPEVPTG